MQHWPEENFDPRQVQIQALEWIEAQSAKYLILQAPVASGKSHIAITASTYFGNGVGSSFVLTPQKVLQKQYKDSFREGLAFALYGKNNYTCDTKNCSCDIGSLINPKCRECPYTSAVKRSEHAPNIIMNYTMALLMMGFHPTFIKARRKLMVIDECHNLEQALIQYSAKKISRRFVENDLNLPWPMHVTDFKMLQEWMDASGYYTKLADLLVELEGKVDQIQKQSTKMSKDDIKVIRRLFRVEEMVTEATEIIRSPVDALSGKAVFDYNDLGFEIRNLYGKEEFKALLDERADKFLFMSGTVDPDGFCEDLGIPRDQCAFLSLESPIPAENRPVVFIPTIRMNYQWLDESNKDKRVNAVKVIKQIITDGHAGESGIIHTTNFKVAEWLKNQLDKWAEKNDYNIIDHVPDPEEPVSRDEAIAKYLDIVKNGGKAILISPSCTEGLDLKHKLGRFSIVFKVPFGNLGDKWIKRRMELSKEWYSRTALYQTMQAAGRVSRDPEDMGTTYILDESWLHLMRTTDKLIPAYWKEAYAG